MSDSNPSKVSVHPALTHLFASFQLGELRTHKGIGLWPVFAEIHPKPCYITLVEALALDGFKITEVSEGGSVPSLRVINETPQHVLLFDGEELKGAKQNRILNTTILMAAGSALDVPVSCTERGRWSYESNEFMGIIPPNRHCAGGTAEPPGMRKTFSLVIPPHHTQSDRRQVPAC